MNGHADLNVEQAFVVGHDLGRVSSLTYFIFFIYIELKPDELPLYQNIAYTFDGYTWSLFGGAVLLTWFVWWILSKPNDGYQANIYQKLLCRYKYGIRFLDRSRCNTFNICYSTICHVLLFTEQFIGGCF